MSYIIDAFRCILYMLDATHVSKTVFRSCTLIEYRGFDKCKFCCFAPMCVEPWGGETINVHLFCDWVRGLLRWKWRCIWHNSLLIGICFPLFTLKVSGMFRFLVSLHFPQILILSGPRHLFWRARLPYTPHFHAPSICVRSVSVDLNVNIHIV